MRTSTHAKRLRRHNGAQFNHRMDEMREHASAMGDAIKGMASTAGATATDQLDPITAYIQKKPLQAALIAAGAGAVLSLIMFRRR